MPAIGEVRSAVLRVARAVKAGDALAEQVARRQLLAWKLADALNRAQEAGLRLTPEEARDWRLLITELAAGRDGVATSGGDAVARLHDAVVAAEAVEGTCDRCGAAVASVSGSVDLTGTVSPPVVLERLCAGCRGVS